MNYYSKRISVPASLSNLLHSRKHHAGLSLRSPETSASLQALPTEILLQIFVHVPYWDLKLRLPLVNKRFNKILKIHGQDGQVSGTELYCAVFKDAPLRRNYVEGTGSLYQLIPMSSCSMSDSSSTESFMECEPTYTPHPVFSLLTFKIGQKASGDLFVTTYLGQRVPLMLHPLKGVYDAQLEGECPPAILMENAVSPAVPVVNITPTMYREGRKPRWDGSCAPLVEGSRRIDLEDGYNPKVHLRRAVTVLDVIKFIWSRTALLSECCKGLRFDLTICPTISDGVLRLDPFIKNVKNCVRFEEGTEEKMWIRSGVIVPRRRRFGRPVTNLANWLEAFC